VIMVFATGLITTVILPIVVGRCKAWPVTLSEEHGMRVFENRALREVFGSKREEVRRGWRKSYY
jgi:hypothetical protein